MSEQIRNGTPTRSVSLENLRPKSGLRKKLKFTDDSVTHKHLNDRSIENERDELLSDLNKMLRTKLRMVDTIIDDERRKNHGCAKSTSQESFAKRSGIEGDTTTVAYDESDSPGDDIDGDENGGSLSDEEETNGLDENANEDDEDFANVDEIDGPISGKRKETAKDSSQSLSEVDYNLPVDDELQEKMDRKAAEIDMTSTLPMLSLPKVDWSLKGFYDLRNDLQEWFCTSNFSYFPQVKEHFHLIVQDPDRFITEDHYATEVIDMLLQSMPGSNSSSIPALAYISMGTFGLVESAEMQLENIRRNNLILCSKLEKLVESFKKIAIYCRDENDDLKNQTTLFFYASTVFFFLVNVCIEQRDLKTREVCKAIKILDETKFLQFLTRYIEHWRWNSRLSMRIRSVILLLFKVLVLQFGDKAEYKRSKSYLNKLHGIDSADESGNKKCVISPLHYEAFTEDIMARFPDYVAPKKVLPIDGDNSNSLSQFLEITRSKVKNPINLTLAAPEKHIATPAPSPPQSPGPHLMNDNLRSRKSFQTNMAYPCLYPSDDEEGDDEDFLTNIISPNEKHEVEGAGVPFSIQEATNILSENLEVKLSIKQLWHERRLFMMTERGWQPDHSEDPYNYLNVDVSVHDENLEAMKRVEVYYKDTLSAMNSLVFVLLQTIESNLSNIDYKKEDFDEKNPVGSLVPRLEITRAKELSMKSSCGILFWLLKWFKLSHVLKYEHLAVLINDSRYVHICSTLLSKYSDHYADKIFNRMVSPDCSFWQHCSIFNDSYRDAYVQDVEIIFKNDYNITALFSVACLLKILRKIILNKTERLKELPLNIGALFKKYYRVFNLDIYHPILRIIKELAPFKNKRWKSEHMELISGVFLYERLELIDNWVTGKDISGELSDACGQEIALRALLQFYNFLHYQSSMEDLGYSERTNSNLSLLNKEADYIGA